MARYLLMLAFALILCVATLLLKNGTAFVWAGEVVTVSFEFPDGSKRKTTLSDDEVRKLLGRNIGYMVEWWVHGALSKLELQFEEKIVDSKGGLAIVSIEGVTNGMGGTWTYYVNSYRSRYHINTQLREGVKDIRFTYE